MNAEMREESDDELLRPRRQSRPQQQSLRRRMRRTDELPEEIKGSESDEFSRSKSESAGENAEESDDFESLASEDVYGNRVRGSNQNRPQRTFERQNYHQHGQSQENRGVRHARA